MLHPCRKLVGIGSLWTDGDPVRNANVFHPGAMPPQTRAAPCRAVFARLREQVEGTVEAIVKSWVEPKRSERAELAQVVLGMIKAGMPVPHYIALQLRSWALSPQDALLPLEEIARNILLQED